MGQAQVVVSAVKCANYDPDLLLEKIDEALELAGPLPDAIKPGAKVLLKPNLLTAKAPEMAATTHPEVVRALIRALRKRGIDNLAIADSPAGKIPWEKLWEATGFLAMAKEEGVELLAVEKLRRVEFKEYGVIPVYQELDNFDALISIPKMKTHCLTKITGATKNMYGLMVGGAKSDFHGRFTSPKSMGMFLADYYELVRPDFAVMDAIVAMEGAGPGNGDPKDFGAIFASSDAAALDSCACEAYGYKAEQIPMLQKVASNGQGVTDEAQIKRNGDAWDLVSKANLKKSQSDFLHRIPGPFFHFLTYILSCRPEIIQEKCIKCGLCAESCSQNAIEQKNKVFRVHSNKCILCFCCFEACPHEAIEMLSPGIKITRTLQNIFSRKKDT